MGLLLVVRALTSALLYYSSYAWRIRTYRKTYTKIQRSNSDARAYIPEEHAVPVHCTFCAVALPTVDVLDRLCRCSGHFWVLFLLRSWRRVAVALDLFVYTIGVFVAISSQ